MKSGLKKFKNETQGARTKEGQLEGEGFLLAVLKKLNIQLANEEFLPISNDVKVRITKNPLVVKRDKSEFNVVLRSKYKQTSGSDWEKIETTWGFINYYYNVICGKKTKMVVILSGFWKELQPLLYQHFIDYIKWNYGEDSIFDFGEGIDEISRFAHFMNVKIDDDVRKKIIEMWKIHKKAA